MPALVSPSDPGDLLRQPREGHGPSDVQRQRPPAPHRPPSGNRRAPTLDRSMSSPVSGRAPLDRRSDSACGGGCSHDARAHGARRPATQLALVARGWPIAVSRWYIANCSPARSPPPQEAQRTSSIPASTTLMFRSIAQVGSAANLRVAVVGSGPAGFYAAARAARERPARSRSTCSTGCRRRGGSSGSASRPTTRTSSPSRARSRRPPRSPASASSATSRSAGTSTHDELRELYDAVVYSVGAQTDRRLGHPRRGPARLVGRHRVRRLVQRPPRLPGPRVRPLAPSARS